MSFKIERKIGNNTYVYQVTSHWDKDKKSPRQKKILIGKRDPDTNEIIPTGKKNKPVKVSDYGVQYFLEQISDKIGLTETLSRTYNSAEELLLLTQFIISEQKPLYLASDWLTTQYNNIKSEKLASQRISELLHYVGVNPDIKFDFFRQWIERNTETQAIYYDVTSLSTYSKNNDTAEWGYNRDKESLPQINVGLIYGEKNKLPLFYDFYQGSIPDVSTLKKTLKFNKEMGIKCSLIVLDRGFFSIRNIKAIGDEKFLIPLPYTTKMANKMIQDVHDDLKKDSSLINYKNNLYYYQSAQKTIDGKKYRLHVVRDKDKYNAQESSLLLDLFKIEEIYKNRIFTDKQELLEELKATAKTAADLYDIICIENGTYQIRRNSERTEAAKHRLGTIIYMTNETSLEAEKVIELQKGRDQIEKVFDSMKNEICQNRLRVETTERADGKIFVMFLAMIIMAYIEKVRAASKVLEDRTKNEILYELKKIRSIKYSNEFTFITEISKKGKDILKAFDIDVKKIS